MNRGLILIGAGIIFYFAWKTAQGNQIFQVGEGEQNGIQPLPSGSIQMSGSNLAAFLMLIRSGESSTEDDAYSMLYGGSHFSDFSDHPRMYFNGPFGKTSAAGAYQITATTWDALRRQGANLPDFSPASQDAAAIALIKGRGAYSDVINGNFAAAIGKLQREWTSLPGAAESRYSINDAYARLASYGATV